MKLESQSDEWLMGKVSKGERACLEILIERFSGPMLTFLRRYLGDHHTADEIFQDVFLAVWAKRKQYKFPLTFRSWLFAIGANKCREHFRRSNRRGVRSELSEPEDQSTGPMNQAIQSESADTIHRALHELPEKQRAVVVMRVWNGLSYSEIATSLGSKEGAVRALMHRALDKLRPTLRQLCEP